MKKLICILLIIVVLTSLLTGCIGFYTCDFCREEKFGIMHKEDVLGTEITYCDDCKETLDWLRGQ
ncbi:MAG: hypothetical protein E7448_03185 [Ruminococcaceae bacterium]|nr:hypothetical protein [Oscillospiraceae bacterium]